MLSWEKGVPQRTGFDFNVDNPIGRELFQKAVKDEENLFKMSSSNNTVWSLYYYKRWLWVQFPWICLERDIIYDKLIEITFGYDGNSYLSFKSEMELLEKIQNIIIDTRERRRKGGQTNSPKNLALQLNPKIVSY